MTAEQSDDVLRKRFDRFATTHWSVVLSAKQGSESQVHEALETLCQTYWYALYAYVRRSDYASHDAEELTQEFLTRLVQRDFLGSVEPQRGRFRSFLLAAMKHFLSHERERAKALKRGGGRGVLSLDFHRAEKDYRSEPVDAMTPQRLFDRRWALTILENAMTVLQERYAASGKSDLFVKLQPCLTQASDSPSYRVIANELSLSEGAVKVAVHRLKRDYRRLLKQQVSQTLENPDDVEDELRDLFAAIHSQT
ncbi:RNA polymerase sigma factor [Novipirellula artificiosorum]|uniref:RNA polymerase sigma factor n=1 Tax=Novipirellula artificiosorum TaxID=2528016 RepID=A0A5C6DY68_9BACT|nr:sigma-70 family RNA polymerase sigma factor [Novipirellula artificiosorum]TWU42373.1 hypothetical protein Poly41_06700 [Novipirellula artificiosorum]